MQKRNYLLLIAAIVVALITMALNTAAMAQKVSGAIFTTNAFSEYVNANVYDYADDVYLNGGPRPNAPCTAAGLPNGDYYFQVTDPSGATLLSTDLISNRRVTVTGGLIVAYSGTHPIGTGKCNDGTIHTDNITVQLFPFNLTPNPGGEYKAWMTKVGDYTSCSFNDDPSTYDPNTSDPRLCSGSFGFIPSTSKTDNFKVIPPPIVGDTDTDGDGVPDSEDTCPNESAPESPDGCPPVPPPGS